MQSIVNKNSKVYYKGVYWNDFPPVQEYMNLNFTGDPKKDWIEDFRERFAKKPFQHGLFINCGNGWVERLFLDKKIVKKVTAFDYSKELLAEAKKNQGLRKIKYLCADVNKINFPNNEFDLVVNVAALHHVQLLNRLCLLIARTLKKNGFFVSFDYIGPSRNQYSAKHWRLIQKVNNSLPKFFRNEALYYPHLPTMLVTDPTEAIHGDLILDYMRKYFINVEQHDTGGGIAYMIFLHNQNLKEISIKKARPFFEKVLQEDKLYTNKNEIPSLFSYFIAQPNKELLKNIPLLKKYQSEENNRERLAIILESAYSIKDYFKLIKHGLKFGHRFRVFHLFNYLIQTFIVKVNKR